MIDIPDARLADRVLGGPSAAPEIQARLWMERPIALLESARAAHGPIFELRLGAVGRVAIVGSAALITEALAVPREAYRVGPFNQNYAMIMGAHGLFLLDGAPHRRLKRMLAPAFRSRVLQGRERVVAEETRRVLSRSLPEGELPLRVAAHEITLRSFLRGALGDGSPLVDRLGEMLRTQVWTDLRQWKAWTRLARLRPAVREMLAPEIAARRAEPGCGDTLDLMVQARDDDGLAMSDDELFDSFMSFLGTAGDGTSIMLSWGLDQLARAPAWQERIAAEHGAEARPALDAVLQEVLRLQPLLPTISGRVLERPVVIGNHQIEAGVALAPCLWLLHRDPDLWEAPAAFRPERFLATKAMPNAMLPFGGKERACLGQTLGPLTLRAALDAATNLAHLSPGSEEPPAPTRFATMLAPPQDLTLRLKSRKAADD